MNDKNDQRWAILPTIQHVIHRCGNHWMSNQAAMTITGHRSRPAMVQSIRKDWAGPVMESRASCGCVRWRGVYDFKIGSDLEMHVLINSKDQSL